MRFLKLILCCFSTVLIYCSHESLGATVVRHTGKIVGGYSADDDYQFPYQASLRDSVTGKHFCGAFLLTERWLGTAGHCTNKRKPTGIMVVVGASIYSKDQGVHHNVLFIAVHPDFDPSILKNDVSMIKTETFIDFTATIKPVRMMATDTKPNSQAFVSGFGRTSNGLIPDTLQWINVKTISLDDCRKQMTKQNVNRIFDTNVCAFPTETSEGGTCMGDSGGPLVLADGALIGIVSWGVPCGVGVPDIYTKISAYKKWIDTIVDFETWPEYLGDYDDSEWLFEDYDYNYDDQQVSEKF